jgi:hypothetical protein
MPEGIIGIKGNYIKHRLVCCNQRAGKSRRDKQLAGSQFRSNRKNQEGKTYLQLFLKTAPGEKNNLTQEASKRLALALLN